MLSVGSLYFQFVTIAFMMFDGLPMVLEETISFIGINKCFRFRPRVVVRVVVMDIGKRLKDVTEQEFSREGRVLIRLVTWEHGFHIFWLAYCTAFKKHSINTQVGPGCFLTGSCLMSELQLTATVTNPHSEIGCAWHNVCTDQHLFMCCFVFLDVFYSAQFHRSGSI